MQPRTDVKFDKTSFNRIKRMIRNMSETGRERQKNPSYYTQIPDEVTLQLTYRCNLRCSHCFQWNETGYFNLNSAINSKTNPNKHLPNSADEPESANFSTFYQKNLKVSAESRFNEMDTDLQKKDLDFEIVKKVYLETKEIRPNMYLYGGETLMYKEWEGLAELIAEFPRRTVCCTNGLFIEKKLDSILKISPNLELLISIDGFEAENDQIRGRGVYRRLISNIDLLLDLKKKGIYQGDIVVHTVINEGMVDKLYDFLEFFEQKGVTSVYFIYPWFLPAETSIHMDQYFHHNFSWLYTPAQDEKCSWHAFKYRLDDNAAYRLSEEVNRMNSRIWKTRVRFQPAVEPEEILDFIQGKETPAQKKNTCLAISNRINILPDGKVTLCKLFPEFAVGDLNVDSLTDIWSNEKAKRCREIINNALMPVCSKCVLLYLSGR